MEVFKAGDWVKIKYGEYEGRLAKIAIHKQSGEYGVILYENNLGMQTEQTASAAIIMLSANALIPLPPYVLSIRQLKSLLSGETAYEGGYREDKRDGFGVYYYKSGKRICPTTFYLRNSSMRSL